MNSLVVSGRPRRGARWRWPALVVAMGLVVSSVLALVVFERERADAREDLEARGTGVTLALQGAVSEATEHIEALAAFFRSSNLVTEDEFDRFVTETGFTPGMFGLGFIRVIPANRVSAFNAALAGEHPGLFLYQVEGASQVPVSDRPVYYPISYFMSVESLPAWGFDVGSEDRFLAAIQTALTTDALVATDFLSFPGRPDVDGFVVSERVKASVGGGTLGVIAAAMDSGDVLEGAQIAGVGTEVQVGVIDLTASSPEPDPGAWTSTIAVADREWRVEVTELGPDHSVLLGAIVFLLGLAVTAAFTLTVAGFTGHVRQRRELEDLRRLDREKDDFLATVSHELRTPLTSIVGFSEALRNPGEFDADERAEMIEFIAEEATAMEGIVQDLLVATRLQQGGEVPIAIGVVPDLAREVRRIAGQVAVIRSVTTTVVGNAAVIADPARLRQIVRNLIDNAARHGKPPVEVTIKERDGRVGVVVTDHGTGVPEAVVAELFDRYRSGVKPEGLPSSTGIGLWLSRALARLMGGDVHHLGGSAFEVVFPAALPLEEAVGF